MRIVAEIPANISQISIKIYTLFIYMYINVYIIYDVLCVLDTNTNKHTTQISLCTRETYIYIYIHIIYTCTWIRFA